MKMKKILKMPLRRIPRRPPPAESLRAKAAAASAETYDEEDYETEEEPNMKFSHALVVVLALHIIAVGGVFAFNSIKAGQALRQGRRLPASRAGCRPVEAVPGKGRHRRLGGQNAHRPGGRHTQPYRRPLQDQSRAYREGKRDHDLFDDPRRPGLESSASAGPVVAPPATDPLTAAAKQPSRRQDGHRQTAGRRRQNGYRQTAGRRRQNGYRQAAARRREDGHRQAAARRRQNGRRQASNRRREDRHRQAAGGCGQDGRYQAGRGRSCRAEPCSHRTISKAGGSAACPHGERRLRRWPRATTRTTSRRSFM